MITALWLAGGLQLLIASSNLFARRMLRYPENLARLDRTVRDVFVILYIYIILMLVAFAVLCFTFAADLAGGSVLGRCLSGFLAGFWGLRALMQVFHYNREIKRQHPVFNALFLGSFLILTAIFATAALR
jgi:hypothetical protein